MEANQENKNIKCIDYSSFELEIGKNYTIKEEIEDFGIKAIYLNEINSLFPFLLRSFEYV